MLTYTLSFSFCWTVPNLITFLSHILSYFIAELYRILTHCWGKSKIITLHRWTIPNLNTMLRYTLPCYIAELFPNLKHSSSITCLITLLRCSQSWNIADVYLVFLDWWDFPNLETLLTFTLSYYIAELFLIL